MSEFTVVHDFLENYEAAVNFLRVKSHRSTDQVHSLHVADLHVIGGIELKHLTHAGQKIELVVLIVMLNNVDPFAG